MDWSLVGPALLNVLPTIVVAVAVIVGIYLNAKWLKAASPEDLKRKEILGYVIMAIKLAEKAVPDTTKNAWLAKADKSMQVFIENYTKYEGQEPSAATKALFVQLREQVLVELDKLKLAKKEKEAAATLAATVIPPVS